MPTSSWLNTSTQLVRPRMGSVRFGAQKEVRETGSPGEREALAKFPDLLKTIISGNGTEVDAHKAYKRLVDNLPNAQLKSSMKDLLGIMKEMLPFREQYLSSIHDKTLIKLGDQLSTTLAATPDKRFAAVWIAALADYGYNAMAKSALENAAMVEDEALRNRLIEKACKSEYLPTKLVGATLLPHVTGEKLRLDLASSLSGSRNKAIRRRAEMVLGKSRLRKSLFSWYYFKTPSAKSAAKAAPASPVKQKSGNELLDDLRGRIQESAMQLHNQLKKQVEDNPELQAAMEQDRWVAARTLPEADTMERQIYDISREYLHQTSSLMAKAYGVAVMERDALELTLALMDIFRLTGMYDEKALTLDNIKLFQSMHQQLQKGQAVLKHTQGAYLQHVRARDRMEKSYGEEQAIHQALEAQYQQAVKDQNEAAVSRVRQQRDASKAILEQMEPTLKLCREACQLAHQKMESCQAQHRLERQRILKVAQFKILSVSSRRMDSVDSAARANPELDKLLAAAEDEMDEESMDKHRRLDEQKTQDGLHYLIAREKRAGEEK